MYVQIKNFSRMTTVCHSLLAGGACVAIGRSFAVLCSTASCNELGHSLARSGARSAALMFTGRDA